MSSVIRLVNVEIPANKRGPFALSYIYGIGRPLAKTILTLCKVPFEKKANEWTEDEYNRIASYIDKNIKVEGVLRSEVMMRINILKDIKCYRGIRHKKNLPVRGQNTRTNCRTRKGKKKTVANKKKAEK